MDERRVGDLTDEDLRARPYVPTYLEWNVAHQVVEVVRGVEPDILWNLVRTWESGEAGQFRSVEANRSPLIEKNIAAILLRSRAGIGRRWMCSRRATTTSAGFGFERASRHHCPDRAL